MPDALARINLNVPPTVRVRLQALAAAQGRTESEMARMLLIDALDGALREQFYQSVAAAQTPDKSARDLQILRAFERLDG